MLHKKLTGREKRKLRIRHKVNGTMERPRLSVFRSARHIYAQVVDDTQGRTLAAVSTVKAELKGKDGTKVEDAKSVGAAIAKLCLDQGIKQVVFDRNGFLYHGRVRALADAAREAGLSF